jgi:hypothetical protein
MSYDRAWSCLLPRSHFEKWNRARQVRDCWLETVQAARDTFGEDHEVTRWARAQLADAEADYGVVVDVLIPSDEAKSK